jgi:hypothetical protein
MTEKETEEARLDTLLTPLGELTDEELEVAVVALHDAFQHKEALSTEEVATIMTRAINGARFPH